MSELDDTKMQGWSCEVGECPRSAVPRGGDLPMRNAVAEAYKSITGVEPQFLFSGWGHHIDEYRRAVVEDRLPDPGKDERFKLEAENVQLKAECERLKLEAQIHAQEARTANATIAEIYQVVSGATGEQGNWNGAQPVKSLVDQLKADIDAYKTTIAGYVKAEELYRLEIKALISVRGQMERGVDIMAEEINQLKAKLAQVKHAEQQIREHEHMTDEEAKRTVKESLKVDDDYGDMGIEMRLVKAGYLAGLEEAKKHYDDLKAEDHEL